jgi:ABC-type Na+ efflux pump permease subunit
VLAVAWREFTSVVKTKAFVISVVMLPVIMLGSIFMQKVARDTSDKTFVVVDRTEGQSVYPMVVSAVAERNKREVYDKSGKKVEGAFILEQVPPQADVQKQRLELSDQVNAGRIFGFLEIGRDVLKPDPMDLTNQSDNAIIRYSAKSAFLSDFKTLIQTEVVKRMFLSRAADFLGNEASVVEDYSQQLIRAQNALRTSRTNTPGVSGVESFINRAVMIYRKLQMQQQLKDLLALPLVVNSEGLLKAEGQGGQVRVERPENEATSFFLPFGAVMMMFLIVLVGAAPMMQVVMEEKQQRIVEVLLGSVTPTQLMTGKLIGMVGTTATLMLIYMTGAWWAVHRMGLQEYVSVSLMVWFVVLTGLAVTMLGSVYVAVGAAVQDLKEAQSLLLPLNVVVMLPMFLIVNVLQNPDRPLAHLLTFWPTSAPMITIARMAVRPGISTPETIGAVIATLVGAFVCVWAAGRIFRVGILMQGKRATLGLLARWIVAPERNATR